MRIATRHVTVTSRSSIDMRCAHNARNLLRVRLLKVEIAIRVKCTVLAFIYVADCQSATLIWHWYTFSTRSLVPVHWQAGPAKRRPQRLRPFHGYNRSSSSAAARKRVDGAPVPFTIFFFLFLFIITITTWIKEWRWYGKITRTQRQGFYRPSPGEDGQLQHAFFFCLF